MASRSDGDHVALPGAPTAVYAASGEVEAGGARVVVTARTTSPERAVGCGAGPGRSARAARLAPGGALDAPGRVRSVIATAHVDGGCLAATIDLSARDLASDAPARIATAAALARQELAVEIADGAAPADLGRQLIERAADPRDAAERAAWWSPRRPTRRARRSADRRRSPSASPRHATRRPVPAPPTRSGPRSTGRPSPGTHPWSRRVRSSRGVRARRGSCSLRPARRAPSRPETPGSGRPWRWRPRRRRRAAPATRASSPMSGRTGSASSRTVRRVPESPPGRTRAASRDSAARAFAADAIEPRRAAQARIALLAHADETDSRALAAHWRARRLRPVPSWIPRPTARSSGLAGISDESVAVRASSVRRGPLRVAVLANADAAQAEAAVRAVDRWVARHPGESRACPALAAASTPRAGTYAVDPVPAGAAASEVLARRALANTAERGGANEGHVARRGARRRRRPPRTRARRRPRGHRGRHSPRAHVRDAASAQGPRRLHRWSFASPDSTRTSTPSVAQVDRAAARSSAPWRPSRRGRRESRLSHRPRASGRRARAASAHHRPRAGRSLPRRALDRRPSRLRSEYPPRRGLRHRGRPTSPPSRRQDVCPVNPPPSPPDPLHNGPDDGPSPWFVVGEDSVRLLRDGVEAFPAMFRAIARAEREILLEMYWIGADGVGARFREALAARARDGVKVRVIHDAVGSLGINEAWWQEVTSAGGQVAEFHSISPFDPRFRLERIERRDHRKLLVVDGATGFTGGINLAAPWLTVAQGGAGWRDDMIEVRGQAAQEMRTLFFRTWRKLTSEAPPDDVQRLSRKRSRPVWVLASQWRTRRSMHPRVRPPHPDRPSPGRHRELVEFVPDRRVRAALFHAVERGAKVRVLIPARSDVPVVQFASEALFDTLLRHGVELWILPGTMLHAKTAILDEACTTIGELPTSTKGRGSRTWRSTWPWKTSPSPATCDHGSSTISRTRRGWTSRRGASAPWRGAASSGPRSRCGGCGEPSSRDPPGRARRGLRLRDRGDAARLPRARGARVGRGGRRPARRTPRRVGRHLGGRASPDLRSGRALARARTDPRARSPRRLQPPVDGGHPRAATAPSAGTW